MNEQQWQDIEYYSLRRIGVNTGSALNHIGLNDKEVADSYKNEYLA